jgi:hypothetical protein
VTTPRWLIAAHVTAIGGVLGADFTLLALGVRGLAGADAATVYPAMHVVAAWVLRPFAVLALLTGIAVAMRGRRLREAWVVVKLAVTVALTALVVLVAEPGLAEAAASVVVDAEAVTGRTRTTYGVVPVATAVLLLGNVILGIYRPSRSAAGTPMDPRGEQV